MPSNSQNILAHEWVGFHVTVKEARDPGIRGLSGIIRDETRNTFQIETEKRSVRVAKEGTVFVTTLPTAEKVTVVGDLLRHRPEDRIKKGLTKW